MLWHQSLIKQALLISLLTSTFKTRCFQTVFIGRLSFQPFFFTPNKRHLNPPDNNTDPSMFKKEMFPRVKQKPAIPEDYFSLSPQTRINTAVFTFCTLYRSIPLQSTTNLCCSRDKNRVWKWESARWKRLSQYHAEVSSVRYIRILLCFIVCDHMSLKEESVNTKFKKTKCFRPILFWTWGQRMVWRRK